MPRGWHPGSLSELGAGLMGKFPGLHGNNLLLALTTCPRSLSLLAGLKPGNCNQSPGNSCYGASRTKAQVKSAGRQSEASGCGGSPPEQTKTLPFSDAALSGPVSLLCNPMPPETPWQPPLPCQSWIGMAHSSQSPAHRLHQPPGPPKEEAPR